MTVVRVDEPRAGAVVHVLDLADAGWDMAAAAADVTSAELARAERGVPAVRRRRVLVRAALRRLLGEHLGLPARLVPLRTDGGRPFLEDSRLRFSCSASEDVALVAISDRPVGVDVERHSDALAASAPGEGWLAPEELRRIAALPAGSRLPAITRSWTQKEAVLKARGTGLTRPPVDVLTPVAGYGRIDRWWVAPVAVPAGYAASLAADAPLGHDALDAVRLRPGGAG